MKSFNAQAELHRARRASRRRSSAQTGWQLRRSAVPLVVRDELLKDGDDALVANVRGAQVQVIDRALALARGQERNQHLNAGAREHRMPVDQAPGTRSAMEAAQARRRKGSNETNGQGKAKQASGKAP